MNVLPLFYRELAIAQLKQLHLTVNLLSGEIIENESANIEAYDLYRIDNMIKITDSLRDKFDENK